MDISLSGKKFLILWAGCCLACLPSGVQAQTCTDYTDHVHWLNSSDTPGTALAAAVKDNYLFVADGPAGLQVINVADPALPVPVHTVTDAAGAVDVVISGDRAFVAAGNVGLHVIDITDPAAAFILGSAGMAGFASGVFVQDDLAYVAVQDSGLRIFDVTDPAAILLVQTVATTGGAHGVHHGIWNSTPYAFVADGADGIQIIHTEFPAEAEVINVTNTPGYAKNVVYKDEFLYVADGSRGVTVISLSPAYFSEAYWLFSNSGSDLTGGHPADLVGTARFAEWVENEIPILGLFTADETGHAEFAPPIDEIYDGKISFRFKLTAPFGADPGFTGTIDILSSDRPGINAGDFRVGLDPVDGTMVFSQDDPLTGAPVDLRTQLAVWETRFWYTVKVSWDDQGRTIRIDWADQQGGYFDSQTDDFASHCFAPDTVGNLISSRSAAAPAVGLFLDWLKVEDSHPRGIVARNVRFDAYAQDIAFRDDHAFAALEYGDLQVIDFTLPLDPAVVGSVDTPIHAHGLAVTADHVFVADRDAGVQIVAGALSASPAPVGMMGTQGSAYGVAAAGNLACIADGDFGLQTVDLTALESPLPLTRVETAGHAMDVAISGTHAYVAEAVFAKTADKSLLQAVFPKATGGGGAKAERYSGLEVVDVSNPATPVVTGVVATPGYALDVEVAGDYAYVADFDGLVVVHVADPVAPVIASSLATPGKARDLAISGGYAFVADLVGLQVIDISNPAVPQLVGSVPTPGSAYGVAVTGTTAFVADIVSGLLVFDVTDPTTPVHLGTVATQGGAFDVEVIGNYAYVSDGFDTDYSCLQIVDVSIPSSPFLAGNIDTPGSVYSVAIEGDHALVTDGGLGLQIFQRQCDPAPLLPAAGFALTRDDGKVSFTWNPAPEGGANIFRLTGAKGGDEWEIPFALDDEGRFAASDPAADQHLGEAVTYSLYYLESEETWVLVATEEVFFEAPRIITRLLGSHPNPFNPHTTVSFSVERSQRVEIRVFDLAGRLVTGLTDRVYEPGYHTADWNGKNASGGDVSSGVYFLRMEADDLAEVKKITLVR